jgi:hypothetical protein
MILCVSINFNYLTCIISTEPLRKQHFQKKAVGVTDVTGFMNAPKALLFSETILDTNSDTKRGEITANNLALVQLLDSFNGKKNWVNELM